MRLLIILLFVFSFAYSKKDFSYGFITSSGKQISQRDLHEIQEGFDIIEHVKLLAKDGRVDDAYDQIRAFKVQNKLKVLQSDIMLAYAEIALKKKSRRFAGIAATELEEAINTGVIQDGDLAKAYMLMVELKIRTNKVKDAKYFAQTIVQNYLDPITAAYGRIYLSKVYKHTKEYSKAIKILYRVLTQTTDLEIATIVADELFDVYILNGEQDKAYGLISKVLNRNIEHYANDSYLALEKVNKLIKADMPEFAVEILQELLKRTTKEESIEDFKYKLANTYMLMYDRTNYYLFKAKELYKDIINDFGDGMYAQKAKMYLDEILMREGQLSTTVVASKYKDSESMQQKVLVQELLDNKKAKKYEYILRSKKVYRAVSDTIAKRFGYESINAIFDEVNIALIKEYLAQNRCGDLNDALKTSRRETLVSLIKDEKTKIGFFECLIEVPYERAYHLIKETFHKSRDAELYLYLERMAYTLGLIDEAVDYSAKVDMVNDKDILAKEFLYRFLILSAKKDGVSLQKFFFYALRNPQFITANKDKPMIIDFYYQFYLYLLSIEENKKAEEILLALYDKQKELKAPVYSPFVQLELAKIEKDDNNLGKAIDYLDETLSTKRRVKPNDLAQIYYELITLNELTGNEIKKDEYVLRCKELEGTKDSLYKDMCDKM